MFWYYRREKLIKKIHINLSNKTYCFTCFTEVRKDYSRISNVFENPGDSIHNRKKLTKHDAIYRFFENIICMLIKKS
jgi:hypothetical protein